MNSAFTSRLTICLFCLCIIGGKLTFGDEPIAQEAKPHAKAPLVEQYLLSGKLAEGEQVLVNRLKEHPQDDEARFGLGTLQFVRSIERLIQSLHRYGLQNDDAIFGGELPFLSLTIPKNEKPEEITYQKMRAIFLTLQTDLNRAETTLSAVKSSDVKLRLHFALIRLDLNGDGKATSSEMLWDIYTRFNRSADLWRPSSRVNRAEDLDEKAREAEEAKQIEAWAKKFAITFDKADATWLQGYCHLLMAFDEFVLAHDWEDAFNRTAFRMFPNTKTGYEFLNTKKQGTYFDANALADGIAFIHLVRFKVKEPKRMQASLEHFETVFRLSRQMWKEIVAEKDDAEEWIPSPTQTGVISNVKITQKQIQGWHEFLSVAESIFQGKILIPHWRVKDGRGINLRRYFLESKRFDLVLLIQGTDAVPYLEKGSVTGPESWRRLQRTFQGQFFGFAIWFN